MDIIGDCICDAVLSAYRLKVRLGHIKTSEKGVHVARGGNVPIDEVDCTKYPPVVRKANHQDEGK